MTIFVKHHSGNSQSILLSSRILNKVHLATAVLLLALGCLTLLGESSPATETSSALALASEATGSLSAVSCRGASYAGTGDDYCTVTLPSAAGAGGVVVDLSSSNSAAKPPASVTVAAGSSSVAFITTIAQVSSKQTATLTATEGGVSKTFTIALDATAVLNGISCSGAAYTGVAVDSCRVTLASAAGASGAVVNLTSSDAAVVPPAAVAIPEGSSGISFSVAIASVSSQQAATLTAAQGGVSKTFALTLGAIQIGLSVNASSVAFGNVALNTTSTQALTLKSSGLNALTISSATVTGAGFSVSGASFPITLSPGSTATLELEFDPTTAGAKAGALTIATNATSGATTVVSLSGTGESSSYQVDLSWSAPQGSAVTIAGYHVYRATSGSSSYAELSSSLDAATSYTDATVQSGVTYDYYVESVDSAGVSSAPSSVLAIAVQ